MNYPNKTFVLETVKDVGFGGHQANQLVIVVADSKETATQHLKDKLNFKGVANELTWLMGCDHPTIYDRRAGNLWRFRQR